MFEGRLAPSFFRSFAGCSPVQLSSRRHAWRAGLLVFILCSLAISGRAQVRISASARATLESASPFSLSCEESNITGAGTDACTVTLEKRQQNRTVTLTSGSSAVSVPPSVTVPSGATTVAFTATTSAVTTAQTAIITAAANGVSANTALKLNAATPGFTMTPPNQRFGSIQPSVLSFGTLHLNTAKTLSVTVTAWESAPLIISAVSISGNGFTITGATLPPGTPPTLPVTLTQGQTATIAVTFDPTAVGTADGTLTVTANEYSGGAATVSLNGTGQSVPAPSAVSCSSSSLTGATTDACTVTLTAAANSGGQTVNLNSSSSAVTVPASVTVASGATTAAFTATASAVTTAQSATITATANSISTGTTLQLNAATSGLTISSGTLSFGSVQLNTSHTQSLTLTSSGNQALTVNAVSVAGSGFAFSGTTFPVTLSPSQTAALVVTFDPTTAGAATGTLTISSNATSGGTATVSLSGTGQAVPALSAVSCSSSSLTGATTDACTVTLTAAANSGGLTVNLSSSSSAVTVPASVTVASGATTAAFTATASAVTTAQSATITATANSISTSTTLQLNAGVAILSVSSSSISFGTVDVNAPATQSAILTASGTAPVTINAASLTGTGFTMSGVSFPLTLQAGQTATLEVTFDPTTAGTDTGAITLTSNCSMGGPMAVSLSGTGQAASYEVELTWDAPESSGDPVAGYNIYRAVSGGSFQLLNTSVNAPTAYTDSTVGGGIAYTYQVTSVDAEGNQSVPSNTYNVTIP